MRRLLAVTCSLLLSGFLIGCGDGKEDLIGEVVGMMSAATSKLSDIKTKVSDAVTKAKKDNAPLDFAEAIKSADDLKKYGEEKHKIKQRLQAFGTVSAEEKDRNADERKDDISKKFRDLVQKSDELQKSLAEAEAFSKSSTANQKKYSELRDKVKDALAPFETMSRQSQ